MTVVSAAPAPEALNHWRLYQLGADDSSKLLLEQTNANFRTTETLFRFGGKHFIVWDAGPPGTRRTIEAYDAASGAFSAFGGLRG